MPTGALSGIRSMKLYLHIGSGKCGTTAIQNCLYENSDQLLADGYYYPPPKSPIQTNHSYYFEKGETLPFQELIDDLKEQERSGRVKAAIVSMEGAFRLDEARMYEDYAQLREFDLQIIFYVRDQAELIQSGALQRAKSEGVEIRFDLRLDADRNFFEVAKVWEKFSGKPLLVARFDRENFPRGNVVYDFLEKIGYPNTDELSISDGSVNDSLAVESVFAMKELEKGFSSEGYKWMHLVDAFLLAQRDFSLNKYFLKEDQVRQIRDHYRESNHKIEEQYDLLTIEKTSECWIPDDADILQLHPELVARAIEIFAIPSFDEKSARRLLQASLVDGWARLAEKGSWSEGETSIIHFRVGRVRNRRSMNAVRISFSGRYARGLTPVSAIKINGTSLPDQDLSGFCQEFYIDDLPRNQGFYIEIFHPENKAVTVKNGKVRQRAFRLEAIDFEFIKKE